MHFQTKSILVAVGTLGVLTTAAPAENAGKRAFSSIVSGSPVGFASGTTGGGNAEPVYPANVEELKKYLTSSDPQNIVISGEYDFRGTEGTQDYDACNSYSCSPEEGGQALLNTLNGCSGSTYSVTLDKAGVEGINVQSDKTLVGKDGATLIGKGLRFVAVSNIIVQNIAITNLNPAYVWGGDAVTFSDTSNIWVDHVHTSKLGRQHHVFGQSPSHAITISNSFVDGQTDHSATCDGHTYWALELVGQDDQITFYRNYVYKTSGRSPALSGSTLFHSVNSVWEGNSGHLIEGTDNAWGLYEGNVFKDNNLIMGDDIKVQMFAAGSENKGQCAVYLGRDCQPNSLSNSGSFDFDSEIPLKKIKGLNIVAAESAGSIESSVTSAAGNTL